MCGQVHRFSLVINLGDVVVGSGVSLKCLMQYSRKVNIKQVAGEGLWNYRIDMSPNPNALQGDSSKLVLLSQEKESANKSFHSLWAPQHVSRRFPLVRSSTDRRNCCEDRPG